MQALIITKGGGSFKLYHELEDYEAISWSFLSSAFILLTT